MSKNIFDPNISQVEYEALRASSKVNEPEPEETKALSETKAEATDTSESLDATDGETATDGSLNDEEGHDDETTEIEEDKKPKKKNGFSKKINKLKNAISDKEREVNYWKEQALKGQSPIPDKPTDQVKADTTSKPQAKDFESHEAYIEALAEWKADEKLKAYEQKTREVQLKTEAERVMKTHIERVESFKKDHDDFDEVIEEVNDVPMSLTVQQLIVESENGPELMYTLAQDREMFERLCKMSPIQAAVEFGKLQGKLSLSSDTKPKKVTTKAPPPLTPVGAKSVVKRSIYDPDLSQADFERLRAEQLRRRRA